jgi:hypothetical protein
MLTGRIDMRISNCLSKKSWLMIGFCLGLAGGAQAGAMGGSGSISAQERTGTSSGASQEGSSGSMGATGSAGSQGGAGTTGGGTGSQQGTSGSSGTSGTSGGTSGMRQGGSSGMGSSQGMGKIQPFQSVDKNGDNYITKSELADSPALLKHFDRADANKDAQLEENEYKNLIMENEQ